jgi:hypothetical protein
MDNKGYISSQEINYEEYLSEISKFPDRNYELGPTASRILLFFATHPYLSTYQIFSSLRGNSDEMAYKNVHKIVKHLHSLKLIELVGKKSIAKQRESIHNPKYYRLTTGGIFSLIYNGQISLSAPGMFSLIYNGQISMQFPGMERIKKLFQNYNENIIFRTILYPYFEEQTLLQMDRAIIFDNLLDYLNKCCNITNTFIESINKNKWDVQLRLFNWDNPEKYNELIVPYLNNQFNLNLTEKIRIEKDKGSETIKISDKNRSVLIRLNEKKDTAVLTTDEGRKYELRVVLDNKNILSIPLGSHREAALSGLALHINYNLLTLVFSINLTMTEKDWFGVGAKTKTNSFNILSKDRKFVSLLERTKKLFDERYQEFIQLKNV